MFQKVKIKRYCILIYYISEHNIQYALKTLQIEVIDFVSVTVTQVHPGLISLCAQVESRDQLKIKKFLAPVPHLHNVGLQQLFKALSN